MNVRTWLNVVILLVFLSSIVLLSSKRLFDSDISKTAYNATSSNIKDSEFIQQDHKQYLASWFATPNINVDQVSQLQRGYDYATSRGKPFVIDGVYHIKANNVHMGTENNGILIRSNSILKFLPQAKLKLISENKELYNILLARGVDNYKVYNPHLVGDRLNNSVTSGEWGYGLTIYESSNGYIEKPIIEDVWGDGIYVGKAWGTWSENIPTNITITEPFVSGARRNGLTLSAGENVQIIKPLIKKVGDSDGVEGTWPKVCIDIEPESAKGYPQARIVNSVIDSPTCEDSYAGMSLTVFPDDIEASLHIKGRTTFNNLKAAGVSFYLGGTNNTGSITIDELFYKTPVYTKLSLTWNKASNLMLNVNKVTYLHEGADFEIRSSDLIGDFPSRKLGNVIISNIETRGDIFYTLPKPSDLIIDGYRFSAHSNNIKGISVRQGATSASLGGKDTYIESHDIIHHNRSPLSSIKLGNTIWVESKLKSADEILVSTATDYRKLKIGWSSSTRQIAKKFIIDGLKVNRSGRLNTQASCKTAGCWIEFQNIEGGDTKILASYGNWTFY